VKSQREGHLRLWRTTVVLRGVLYNGAESAPTEQVGLAATRRGTRHGLTADIVAG
jgi:hypothetical protein